MWLKKLEVQNFLLYEKKKKIEFSKEKINVLIGQNNCGKSTILKAINLLFGEIDVEYLNRNKKKQLKNGSKQENDNKIIIKYYFQGVNFNYINEEENEENEINDLKNISFVIEREFKFEFNNINNIIKCSNCKGASSKKNYKLSSEELEKWCDDNEKNIKNFFGGSKETDIEKILNKNNFKINYFTPNTSPEEFEKKIKDIIINRFSNDFNNFSKIINKEITSFYEGDENSNENESIKQKIKKDFDELSKKIREDLSIVFSDKKIIDNNEYLELKQSLDVDTENIKKEIIKKLNVKIFADDFSTNFQGTGFQRILTLSLLKSSLEQSLGDEQGGDESYQEILLIDEPEAFLHPQAVEEIKNILYSLNIQTIISTHSPIMIDLTLDRELKLMKFNENGETLLLLEDNPPDQKNFNSNHQNRSRAIADLKAIQLMNPYLFEFFFAEKIIIVEGDTEEILFKTILKEEEFKDEKTTTKIINAKSKDSIKTFVKIINNMQGIKYSVLFDLDNWKLKNDETSSKDFSYMSKSVKGSWTKSQNIFKETKKNLNNVNIIATIGTLEIALGGKIITNKKKTENILKILNDDDFKNQKDKAREILRLLLKEGDYDDKLEGFVIVKKIEDIDKQYNEDKLIDKP